MAITLGLVEAVDSNGVYVSMPGTRGVLRGPFRTVNDVAVGSSVLVQQTDDGEQVVVGSVGAPPRSAVYNVKDFGAVGDGVVDDSAAIQAAIDACIAAGGGVVHIPAGQFKIGTTLNLTGIHTSFGFNQGVSITVRGSGNHATYLLGGESSYGFMELVGSNRVTVSDMALVTTDHSNQYGILAGRATGDGSSGEHVFRDLIVHGQYRLAAIFTLSSEGDSYERVKVFTTAYGHGIVAASDLSGWSAYTGSKFEALSSTIPLLGGNGVISMTKVTSFTSTTTTSPLWLEYVQSFTGVGLYLLSYGGPIVKMAKGCHEATFISLHQEWSNALGASEPYGFSLAAASKSYRISITGSSVYSLYAASTSQMNDFSFRSSRWRGTATWHVDASKLYNADIRFDGASESEVTVANYRARDDGRDNQVSPALFTTTERNAFTTDLGPGRYVFDTTLGIPIWSTASAWVDATGTAV